MRKILLLFLLLFLTSCQPAEIRSDGAPPGEGAMARSAECTDWKSQVSTIEDCDGGCVVFWPGTPEEIEQRRQECLALFQNNT